MPIFSFTAKDALGVAKAGSVEALNKDNALNLLKSQNLIVVSIQEKQASLWERLKLLGGVSEDEVTNFTREFSTMISSGLAINKALVICTNQFENQIFKNILQEVTKDIDSGTSLSGALSKFPAVFDTSYISLVKAGESSGKLEVVLQRLAESYEAIRDLKSRLKAALIYPAIVLVGQWAGSGNVVVHGGDLLHDSTRERRIRPYEHGGRHPDFGIFRNRGFGDDRPYQAGSGNRDARGVG